VVPFLTDKRLQNFAMRFSDDLLTMESIYLVTYAWCDISPSRKREASTDMIGKKVEGG
jgi:hypothetical protein